MKVEKRTKDKDLFNLSQIINDFKKSGMSEEDITRVVMSNIVSAFNLKLTLIIVKSLFKKEDRAILISDFFCGIEKMYSNNKRILKEIKKVKRGVNEWLIKHER
jgi:hypothetical protein